MVGKYENLSEAGKLYLRTDMNFQIVARYLDGIEEIDKSTQINNYRNRKFDKNIVEKNKNELIQFVDSLQLIGNVSDISFWYHVFITDNLEQEQRRFFANRGRRSNEDNFRENIFFASVQYVGYPYYYSVYEILKKEILKGNLSSIAKELNDFCALPCSPTFKNALNHLIQKMELIKVGNPFPFLEIVDVDGNSQNLPKGELCIMDLHKSYFFTKPRSVNYQELEELTRI